MKKILFYLLLSLFATNINAQVKKGNSLFWEISGNGLTKPSYLYGTMHVSSKTAFHLTDSFFVAIKNVDFVALESRPEEWIDGLFNSDLMEKVYASGGVYNKAFANEDNDYSFYNIAFNNYLPKRGDMGSILAIEPSLINGILFRTQGYSQDYEEDTYLDMFIYQCGKKMGKQTVGLESFFGSMVMEMMASKAQRDEDKSDIVEEDDDEYAEEKYTGAGDSYETKLNDAYRIGDIRALDSLSKKSSGKGFHKFMIIERNKIMAHTYDSIIKTGKSLFAGIGAAHLSGNDGVLQMLKDKGYSIRPMEFSNPKPSKAKSKMEETVVAANLSSQYIDDEGISLLGVEKYYTFPTPGSFNFYLTFDLANGAFYFVNTLPTYAAFEGKTPEFILDQMDSLVYEFTAGKMISHKRIQNNIGYPGLEVVSKTKRGDIQKYRFYVGPQKIYSFKVAGHGEYVNGKDVDKFFNSIVFDTKNIDGFSLFKPNHQQYEVLFPNERVFSLNPDGFKNNFQGEKLTGIDSKTGDFYSVTKANYPEGDQLESDTFELSFFIDRFSKNYKADILTKTFDNSFSVPRISATLKKKDGYYMFIDIVKKGNEFYMLLAQSKSDKRPNTFFESFKFTDANYLKQPYELVDTFLKFKTKFIGLSKEYSDPKYVNYEKISKSILGKEDYYYGDEADEIEISDAKDDNELVYSDSTGEYISVRSVLESKYFWEDTSNSDSNNYYEKIGWGSYYTGIFNGKNSNADSTSWRRIKLYANSKGDTCREYLTTRMGSREVTWSKRIDRGRLTYYLRTSYDSILGPSAFKKTFFDAFETTDTFPAFDKYSDKTLLILADLYSTDTTTKKQARFGLSVSPQKFGKNNYVALKSAIEDPRFYDLPFAYRSQLIFALGEHPKERDVVAVLEKIYRNAGDTSDLQLWVLETLSNLKTKEASVKFGDLIVEETPIDEGKYGEGLYAIFGGFRDSVELGTQLLPQFMELMKIPEYKDIIVELLGFIGVQNPLDVNVIKDNKLMILREANAEFKRVNIVSSGDVDEVSNESEYEKKNDFYYNNNYDDGYIDWGDTNDFFYTRNYLGDYIVMLLPIKEDPLVQSFFSKILKAKELKEFIPNYLAQFTKGGYAVPDSMWNKGLANYQTRNQTLLNMQKLGLQALINQDYFSTDSIVWNALYSNLKSTKDSIVFLEKRQVNSQFGSGDVYIYKRKSDKNKKWNLDITYLLADKEYANSPPKIGSTKKGIEVKNTDDKIKEEVAKFVDTIKLSGRQRATNEFSSYDDNYFGD